MFYIKLDEEMKLTNTSYEPIYRGDNLNRKIIYLVPKKVGEIDMEKATIYLSYIRADGTADIALLRRMEEMYREEYLQFTLPITSTLTRYAGEVCTFLTVYSGPISEPVVAKSSELMIRVLASTDMDEYISDRNLSLIYQMQQQMEEKIEQTNEAVTAKADSVSYDPDTGTLQLMSGGDPVGDAIHIRSAEGSGITGASINDQGELVIELSDGTTSNLGVVKGKDGGVYVPRYDEHKVLTFTYQDTSAGGSGGPIQIPPVDCNPNDEWSDISGGSTGGTTTTTNADYFWEKL